MTLAKAKAKTNETFIEQVSLTIVPFDHQNMFIVQTTGVFLPVKNLQTSLILVLLVKNLSKGGGPSTWVGSNLGLKY